MQSDRENIMASVSSVRCKQWREKRKDDVEYWDQERTRKRKARQSRTEEKKQHDNELGKKRQKRYRERKRLAKYNVPFTQVNIASVNDDGSDPAISEDVRSSKELATQTASDPCPSHVSLDTRHVSMDTSHVSMDTSHVSMDTSRVSMDTSHVSMNTGLDKRPENVICKSGYIAEEDGPVFLYNENGNSWHTKRQSLNKQCEDKAYENMEAVTADDHEGIEAVTVDDHEGRQAYFERIQTTLSKLEDFAALQKKCNEFSQQIEKLYPIGNLPTLNVTEHQLDNVATSLYPHEDAPNDSVPIRTLGDGNCLPRVGSVFAFGNDKQHNEIRVRMFIEMCLYEHYYLDDSYLKRGTEEKGLVDIAKNLALFSDVFVQREEDGVRLAFRQYVISMLKKNSFNSMWSIFALSSVLGAQVSSIYPSYGGNNVRSHLHRLVMPRVSRQEKNQTVHIMWTSTTGKQQEPKSWTPNHFVAVLPTAEKWKRITLRQSEDLPIQREPSGSQLITDSISSTDPDDFRAPAPIEPTSTIYDAYVESPTTHFLNSVCKTADPICPNDTAHLRTTVLTPTGDIKVGELARVNRTLCTQDECNVPIDQRSEDRCTLHPQEQLLYLCTTCDELPICYKCHLESHQQHRFEDLKQCLADNEEIYLRKITKRHEDDLKNEIKQQKRVHVENMESIDGKIKRTFEYYTSQLAQWRNVMLVKKSKADQEVTGHIQILETELRDTDTITKNARQVLKSLSVSERLTVMIAEPPPELKKHPRTHLVFHAGPNISLDQFGTLEKISYLAELSKSSVSTHEPHGSGITTHTAHANASGSQYQENKALCDDCLPPSLATDHAPGKSANSTGNMETVVPLTYHGLNDDRALSAIPAVPLHDYLQQSSAIPAVPPNGYLQQSSGIPAVAPHGYLQKSIAIPAVPPNGYLQKSSAIPAVPPRDYLQQSIAIPAVAPHDYLQQSIAIPAVAPHDYLQQSIAIPAVPPHGYLQQSNAMVVVSTQNFQNQNGAIPAASNHGLQQQNGAIPAASNHSYQQQNGAIPAASNHSYPQQNGAIPAASNHSYQQQNDAIPAASNHSYPQQSSAIPAVSVHNDHPLSHGLSTVSTCKDQPKMYGIHTEPTLNIQSFGNGMSAVSTNRHQPRDYAIRSPTSDDDQLPCVDRTAVGSPKEKRVDHTFHTVSTIGGRIPHYVSLETLQNNDRSQTTYQQNREQMTLGPDDSDAILQPTDSALTSTTTRHDVFRDSSEMETDICRRGAKNEATLGMEQRGEEYVMLVKSDNSDKDHDPSSIRECDATDDVRARRMSGIGQAHEITLPKGFRVVNVLRSVCNKLYVWRRFRRHMLAISKDGYKHEIIDLKSNNVYAMDVSPIDGTLWFVSDSCKIKCVLPTGTVETKFTVDICAFIAICVTRKGEVLVSEESKLTLYTDRGEVVRSTDDKSVRLLWSIRECSLTRNILEVGFNDQYRYNIILYDNMLQRKFTIDRNTVQFPNGHKSDVGNDVRLPYVACFDTQGNILIGCDWDHIILVDHTNGRYIKTVYSQSYPITHSFDVDDEGVLWTLDKFNGEVKRIQL